MEKDGYKSKLLSSCDYFTTYAVDVDTKAVLEADEKSFVSILVLEGEGQLVGDDVVSFKKGDSFFIPANSGKFAVDGKSSFILTRV